MKKVIGILTAGLLLVCSVAFGGSNDTPGIDKRQANQDRRIQKGIESGQLTDREARRLNRRMNKLDRIENRAKADGVVTKRERKRMHKAMNRNSKAIAKQKHDRQGKRRP